MFDQVSGDKFEPNFEVSTNHYLFQLKGLRPMSKNEQD